MTSTQSAPEGQERRVLALDGIRGVMTILVVISHYFGELPNGIKALSFGWVAVDMFFVLSGYLIGKLIIEKGESDNFFKVFYMRRICRIIPSYMVTIFVSWALIMYFRETVWIDADPLFPLWSYVAFVQNFFMVSTESIGAHWLAPTWTLVVEEHFYLIAPSLIVFTPKRYFRPVLIVMIVSALIFRILTFHFGMFSHMTSLVLLPGRADLLMAGVFAASLITTPGIDWKRWMLWVRAIPLIAVTATLVLSLLDGEGQHLLMVYSPLILAIGCASFLLGLVIDVPEAQRYKNATLRFFGDNSYAIYLTHMQVLGLMHGLILGSRPDITTWEQVMVSVLALPVAVVVGRALTRFVEEPMMAYGRSWRWSKNLLPRPYR